MLGIDPGVVRMWRHRKTGPTYFRVVGKIVYRETDIIDFLNANIAVAEHLPRQRGGKQKNAGRKKNHIEKTFRFIEFNKKPNNPPTPVSE
jgi:hypothetical protein